MASDTPRVADWTEIPSDERSIEVVRERCRRLVRRRAAWSAGVAVVPVPGVDILSDASMLAALIGEINQSFGLSEEQVDRLQPTHKLLIYQAAVGVGGMMVGKLVTKELLVQLLKRSGMKVLAKSAGKFVPVAGQLASAAIGFAMFRKLGYEHVEACAKVARTLAQVRNAPAP